MENIDGALGFKATLDIKDFKVSAEAMERNIRNVSATAISESDKMDDSIQSFAQNGARYIVSYLVGQGMGTLLQSIVQTRGQFQQLEIAFSTMLRSNSQAKKLMDELIVTAAKTPFDLQGIASTTKQMLAYGSTVDNVVDELVMLGNVASGVGAPLGDIAYLYGTLRTQGRAFTVDIRQFAGRGIPIYEELAKVLGVTKDEVSGLVTEGKVGFAEVEKAFQNMTSSSGIYYNLMQEQSKSLTGMISNLGDAWDNVLNDFGKSNQDLFAGAIQGATYFVEHMDDVLRIVKAIVLGYGSLKAAIVLNTLATKGYTGVALIDNTARQAKIALMRVESKMSGEIASITKKMEEAEKAHIKSLQEKITIKQHQQALDKVHIAAINDILTAEQKRYLSNLNLTSSSRDYLKEAESILTVEQKSILKNQDKTKKMQAYADTIAEMAKQNEAHIKSLKEEAKGLDERASQLAKSKAAVLEDVEAARYEVYWAKQGNDARKIGNAERRLSASTQRLDAINTEVNTIATRKNTIQKQLNTLESRKSAAVGLADVTAKTAQTTATNLLTIATGKLKFALSALWASMKANPIGWLVTAIGMTYSAYEAFFKKTEETLSGVKKATKSATDEFSKQAGQVDALRKIINDGNASYDLRNAKLKELKGIIPGYNAELTKEGEIINDNTKAIKEYLTNLEKQIKLKAAQEELEELYRQKRLKEKAKKANEKDVEEANKYLNAARFSASVNSQKLSTPGMKSLSTGMDMATKNAEDDLSRANKALAATNREIEDIENTINELNNEINAVSSSMNNSTANVKSYSEQVNDARKNVDLLKKELAELRSGKVEKENLAKAIEEKENDLKVAQRKLDTLTGYKNNKKNDALNEKQLEADRKLEADRIAVMEDGYEKRKALLDLQHKKALDDINKEEKALEKARKESGNGGLSRSEKDGFNERRNLENKSYNKAQNKLFDGELDYKKKQYELYFRWVRNMGEDVANKQFASLLKGGASYKEYVESQIMSLTINDGSRLSERKGRADLSVGEANFLGSLKAQYNEITGAKSAMDSFKDSVTQSISQAQTLAEKLEALADAKDRVANKEIGLISEDEKTAAYLFLENFQKDINVEVESLVNDYKGYTQKKIDIEKKYSGDLEILLDERRKAEESGNLKKVKVYNEALAKLKQNLKNDLSALSIEMFKDKINWSVVFDDLDKVSTESLFTLRDNIKNYIDSVQSTISPEQLKILIDIFNQLNERIAETQALSVLGKSWNEYRISCDEARTAQEEYNEVVKEFGQDSEQAIQAETKLKNAQDKRRNSLVSLNKSINSFGGKIGEITDTANIFIGTIEGLGLTVDENVKGLLDGFGTIASGLESMDITRPFSLITGALKTVGGIGKTMASAFSLGGIDWGGEKSRRAYQKAVEQYQHYMSVLDDVIDKQKELVASMDVTDLLNAENSYTIALQSIQKTEAAARELGRQYLNAGASKGFLGIGSSASNGRKMSESISGAAWAELEAWKGANQVYADFGGRMTALFDLSSEQLATLKRDAPLFWSQLHGDVQNYLDKIIQAGDEAIELKDILNESLTGLSFSSFADSILSDLTAIEIKAEDVSNNISNSLRESLIKNLWRSSYKDELEKYYQMWADAMKPDSDDGSDLSKKERAALEALKKTIVNGITGSVDEINKQFPELMDSTSKQDPLTGAVRAMSEETGSVIAGRLNAFTINQTDQTAVMRRALEYQAEIAANTRISAKELTEIKLSLKRIENSDRNSLLPMGIS